MYNAICLLSIYNIILTHKVFISLLGESKCELMLVQCSEWLDDEFYNWKLLKISTGSKWIIYL